MVRFAAATIAFVAVVVVSSAITDAATRVVRSPQFGGGGFSQANAESGSFGGGFRPPPPQFGPPGGFNRPRFDQGRFGNQGGFQRPGYGSPNGFGGGGDGSISISKSISISRSGGGGGGSGSSASSSSNSGSFGK